MEFCLPELWSRSSTQSWTKLMRKLTVQAKNQSFCVNIRISFVFEKLVVWSDLTHLIFRHKWTTRRSGCQTSHSISLQSASTWYCFCRRTRPRSSKTGFANESQDITQTEKPGTSVHTNPAGLNPGGSVERPVRSRIDHWSIASVAAQLPDPAHQALHVSCPSITADGRKHAAALAEYIRGPPHQFTEQLPLLWNFQCWLHLVRGEVSLCEAFQFVVDFLMCGFFRQVDEIWMKCASSKLKSCGVSAFKRQLLSRRQTRQRMHAESLHFAGTKSEMKSMSGVHWRSSTNPEQKHKFFLYERKVHWNRFGERTKCLRTIGALHVERLTMGWNATLVSAVFVANIVCSLEPLPWCSQKL